MDRRMTPTERLHLEVAERRAWTPAQMVAAFGGRTFGGRTFPADEAVVIARLSPMSTADRDPRLILAFGPTEDRDEWLIPPWSALRLLWPSAARRIERAGREAREDDMAARIAAEDPAEVAALRAHIEAVLPDGFRATEVEVPPSRRLFGYRRTVTYRVDISRGDEYIRWGGGTARVPAYQAALEAALQLRFEDSVRAIDPAAEDHMFDGGRWITVEGRNLILYRATSPSRWMFGSQEADIFSEVDDYGGGGVPWIVREEEYLTPAALRAAIAAIPPGGLPRPAGSKAPTFGLSPIDLVVVEAESSSETIS